MLVIFDLDGTLLNTLADLSAAVNYALGQEGFPLHSPEQCRRFLGNGISKLLERALPPAYRTAPRLARVTQHFLTYYNAHLADTTVAYPGMGVGLAQLRSAGVQLGVASNKYQHATEQLIKQFFPDIAFTAVLGQRPQVPRKPDPQVVREILQASGCAAADCWLVGDSQVDMQTARNSGVTACAVTWGFRSREELAVCAPDYWANTPGELVALIMQQIEVHNRQT